MSSTISTTTPSKKSHKRELSGHICTACDQCYRCKVKCTGEKPECERCRDNKSACTYSKGKPLGKPKGSKNKVQRPKALASDVLSTSLLDEETKLAVSRSSSGLKRSLDGELPVAKRRVAEDTRTASSVNSADERGDSPLQDSSELHHFDPRLTSILPGQNLTSYNEPASFFLEDNSGDGSLTQDTTCSPTKADDLYVPGDSSLDFEDLKWFGQADDLIPNFSTSTSPAVDMSMPVAPMPETCGAADLHESPVPPAPTQEDHALKAAPFQYFSLPCLCDPMALNIISELQFLQTSLSPLDTALILARRGFSTVSSSLSCPSCLSSSRSLFYACILIIQQVFTCYGTVKLQGQKMLGTITKEKPKTQTSVFSIGEFEVEDEEGCNGILDAIVKAEMERGKGVIGGLERWVENSSSGSPKVATLLLRTLREEIGC